MSKLVYGAIAIGAAAMMFGPHVEAPRPPGARLREGDEVLVRIDALSPVTPESGALRAAAQAVGSPFAQAIVRVTSRGDDDAVFQGEVVGMLVGTGGGQDVRTPTPAAAQALGVRAFPKAAVTKVLRQGVEVTR